MNPALELYLRQVALEGPRRVSEAELCSACHLSGRFPVHEYLDMLRKLYIEENGERYPIFENLEYEDGLLTVEAGPGMFLHDAKTSGAKA